MEMISSRVKVKVKVKVKNEDEVLRQEFLL